MGWTSYYVGRNCDRKAECMKYLDGYRATTVLKTVMKGSKFYALLETKGEQWILLLLTRVEDGEFYYKDIQCNPCEMGVPISILRKFKPSNERDEEWLEKSIAYLHDQKLKTNFKPGDLLEVTSNYPIVWSYGMRIEKGETFRLKVDIKNPFAKRKTNIFRVVIDGRVSNYVVNSKTMKYCDAKIIG